MLELRLIRDQPQAPQLAPPLPGPTAAATFDLLEGSLVSHAAQLGAYLKEQLRTLMARRSARYADRA